MSRGPRSAQAERDGGHGEVGCSILHVDLDAFVASVELARRPQLRGLPVIVGDAHGGGCVGSGGGVGCVGSVGSVGSVVLASTYEARAFGVHAGMAMATALRQCPRAVVVPPDDRAYREVSAGVMRVLGDITPLVEQVSRDEAFLDVVGACRRIGPPTVIAELVRRQVREQFGITCSIGIGSTKLVARLASGHAKPDGVLVVPRTAALAFLRTLPVGALSGVGEKSRAALAGRGISTVAELADADVATVQHLVGRVAGARLMDLAWGRDLRPVRPRRDDRSIGAEDAFSTAAVGLAAVEDAARELAGLCAARLRADGLVTRMITVKIRTEDGRTLTRSRALATPTDVGREMFLAARELLAGIDLAGGAVRLVGVRAEDVSRVATGIRPPTVDEAWDAPATARYDEGRDGRGAHGRSGTRPVEAGVSQAGGVSSRSTTTFVPADLS